VRVAFIAFAAAVIAASPASARSWMYQSAPDGWPPAAYYNTPYAPPYVQQQMAEPAPTWADRNFGPGNFDYSSPIIREQGGVNDPSDDH
jgi:hypothetical protein